MIARDGDKSVAADIESDDGNMGGAIAGPRRRLHEIKMTGREDFVEWHHAIRQRAPEATDLADRKQLGRHLHGDLGMSGCANARRCHNRFGADAFERGGYFLLAPEQRQRHRDHAGAQHAEQGDGAFHRMGKLDRHHGVGLQAEPPQLRGQRRYRSVGLRVSQPARRTVGESLTVGRIEQRQRIRAPHAGAAEQVVERGAVAGRFAIFVA